MYNRPNVFVIVKDGSSTFGYVEINVGKAVEIDGTKDACDKLDRILHICRIR